MDGSTLWPSLASAIALIRVLSNSPGAISLYSDTVSACVISHCDTKFYWIYYFGMHSGFDAGDDPSLHCRLYGYSQPFHTYNGASKMVTYKLLFPSWATKLLFPQG
jgi:hypothetical protein